MLPNRVLSRFRVATVAAAVLLVVAAIEYAHAKPFDFRSIASGELPQLRYKRFDNWQPAGVAQLVVWDGEKRPWLVGVAPPCAGLEKARLIGITAMDSRVHVGADEVIAGGRRCRIQHLQRLDFAQLVAAGQLPTERRSVQIRPRQPAPSIHLRRGN